MAVALALLLLPAVSGAQQDPTVLATAVHTIDLVVGSTPSGTPMSVAFDPRFGGRYYAATGGNPSYHGFVFNTSGVIQQNLTPINVDVRSFNYNSNTGNLEVVAFNAIAGGTSGGILIMGRNASGNLTGTNPASLATVPGLATSQTMPAYDPLRNRLYSRGSGFDVNIVNRTSGALISSVTLDTTGLGLAVLAPAGPPSPTANVMGYDSTYSVLLLPDPGRRRVLVFRLDGSFLGSSVLPANPAITISSSYFMGYANGQVFFAFNDGSGLTWYGFRVLGPPTSSTMSIGMPDQQYRIIGQSNETASPLVSNTFASALGSPDTTQWRLGRWSPTKNAYQLAHGSYAASGLELTTTRHGEGYWLITRGAKNVVIGGSKTPTTAVIPLLKGPGNADAFNQLGNPFDVAIPVSSLRIRQGTGTQYLTAATNTLTDNVIWTWNGSAYQPLGNAGSLPANAGFFLLRKGAGAADIVYARPGVNPEPALTMEDASEIASDPRLWSVSLTASQGGRAGTPLVIGLAAADVATLDAMSHRLPPAPPGGAIRLVSERIVEGERTDDLAFDYRAPAAATTWTLTLEGAEAPGELTIAVETENLPAGASLELVDPASGVRYPLSPGEATTMAAFAGARKLELRVDVYGSVAGPAASASAMRLAYPNPFRGSTGLTFALSRAGDAVVDVFDLQGRLVQRIERRGLTAGEHVLVWDGNDLDGRAAKSGVYLARWRTPDATGTARLVRVN